MDLFKLGVTAHTSNLGPWEGKVGGFRGKRGKKGRKGSEEEERKERKGCMLGNAASNDQSQLKPESPFCLLTLNS